jgi:hypothetical protein
MKKSPKNYVNMSHSANTRSSVKVEIFKALVDAGNGAVKLALAINGGACVVLLGFYGQIWDKGLIEGNLSDVSSGMTFFTLGVLFAALATGSNYFSLLLVFWERFVFANIMTATTILLIIISYVSFWYGSSASVQLLSSGIMST